MKENQFFEELKTSLGQAIDQAEGNHSKVRTKTVAIKELATFSAQDSKDLRLQMNSTQKSFAALMGSLLKRSIRGNTAPTKRCSRTSIGSLEQSATRSRGTANHFCLNLQKVNQTMHQNKSAW